MRRREKGCYYHYYDYSGSRDRSRRGRPLLGSERQ